MLIFFRKNIKISITGAYLILNRNIKRGNRPIADNECWVEGDGAGNTYPLALPAGELVEVAEEELLRDTDVAQKRGHAFGHFLPCVAELVRFQQSATMSRTVMRGLREA